MAAPGDQRHLGLVTGNLLHRERCGGCDQIGDRIDAFGIEPLARDVGGNVSLVLVVGGDDLDRFAGGLATEFLDRELSGDDGTLTRHIGV